MPIFGDSHSDYSRQINTKARSAGASAGLNAIPHEFILTTKTRPFALASRRKRVHEPTTPPLFSHDEWAEIVQCSGLSPRQAQILGLVIQSHTDKEIAAVLDIKHSTVRSHIDETKERLLASDRVGLAYRAFWMFRSIIEPKRYPWLQRDSR